MRRTYRYNPDLDKCIEVFDEPTGPECGPVVMKDLDAVYNGGFKSPINGEFITSRSQLRAHEARYNVKQGGDFKPGELIAKEKSRVEANRKAAAKGGGQFEWM